MNDNNIVLRCEILVSSLLYNEYIEPYFNEKIIGNISDLFSNKSNEYICYIQRVFDTLLKICDEEKASTFFVLIKSYVKSNILKREHINSNIIYLIKRANKIIKTLENNKETTLCLEFVNLILKYVFENESNELILIFFENLFKVNKFENNLVC